MKSIYFNLLNKTSGCVYKGLFSQILEMAFSWMVEVKLKYMYMYNMWQFGLEIPNCVIPENIHTPPPHTDGSSV